MKKILALTMGVMFMVAQPLQAFAAWYENSPLIAHALGEANGKIEVNSKEAFLSSWGNGYTVLEADFMYTSDGQLVIRHDFSTDGSYYRLEQVAGSNLVMDSATYAKSQIVYEQTPLTAVDLLYLMVEYPDVYVVTDTKNTDEATVKKQFSELVKIANNIGAPEVLERLVPQIYNNNMYTWVKSVYNFPEWIYTLYLDTNPNYEAIALFCQTNGIKTVTVNKERVTAEMVSVFHAKNILLYAHTVNRYLELQSLLAMGVDGVYTDRIKPYELSWVGLNNPRALAEKELTVSKTAVKLQTLAVLGEEYVSLRSLATLGKKFSAQYDMEKKTLALTTGKAFVSLGNELLLDGSGKLVTQKADFTITLNGKASGLSAILVDGEVFVPLAKAVEVLELG